MGSLSLFHAKTYWYPLSTFGLTSHFWRLNAQTIIFTWVTLGILIGIICLARYALRHKASVGEHIVLSATASFKDMIMQSLGVFNFNHFAFIASLFTFILLCNILPLIPWLEEPTNDLSTTLALGLSSFFYVQGNGIKAHGLIGYLKEFAEPFFFMVPMHIIGALTTVVSLSFRLFGNIMGGSIISTIYLNTIGGKIIGEILGIISGGNMFIILFFVLFEGIIQAFVFSMLSLTYLSLAIKKED